jgi:Trm5-related predicted tRNA methylase
MMKLRFGIGIPKDINKSDEICLKLASEGNKLAKAILFYCGIGQTKKRKKKATKLFFEMVKEEKSFLIEKSFSLYFLGESYCYGYGVEVDPTIDKLL